MAFQVGAPGGPAHGPPTRRHHPNVPSGRADLHVHSIWSDGAQRPETIVRAAAGRLDVFAITDHDEIHGARLARDFARAHPALGIQVRRPRVLRAAVPHLTGRAT